MLLLRWVLLVCWTLTLILSCSGGSGGGSGGSSEPRLSVPSDKGEEDPVITVRGPFKQNVTIELFSSRDCQGVASGSLDVVVSPENHRQQEKITHQQAVVGAYTYSVGVTTQGVRECIKETISYSKATSSSYWRSCQQSPGF